MHIHHPRLLIDNPTKLLFINFRCNCARSVFGQCKIELKHCITEVRFPVPLNEANKGSMNHIVWQQNRPFASSGQMVRNKLCWDANNAVKLPKQRNSYQSSPTFISFGKFHCAIPAFRTMWPARAKGLFWQVAEKQFQFLTLQNHNTSELKVPRETCKPWVDSKISAMASVSTVTSAVIVSFIVVAFGE